MGERAAKRLTKLGIDPLSLNQAQVRAAEQEVGFQEAMRKFKEPTVSYGKQKSKKYLRAYWKYRAIQEQLARACFDEIEAQIDELLRNVPASVLNDPEVVAYLTEVIKDMRSPRRGR